jgi:diadenosine tetraphosphatase ApaH/serine/threonine PP2A family protein phosphatase
MEEAICFAGHTHGLELIDYDGQRIRRSFLSQGRRGLSRSNQYIVNAGSVGQPRDDNKDAKYIIWDADTYALDVRFIPYDAIAVSDKIIDAGLPEIHARILV